MLIQRNLHLKFNIKALLIGTGAATGVIMVINLLSMYHCGCNTINQSLYTSTALPIFFILGIIITSSSFEELQSSAKGCFYLTLPVSNLERLASAWLVGSVIYYIYSVWMGKYVYSGGCQNLHCVLYCSISISIWSSVFQ